MSVYVTVDQFKDYARNEIVSSDNDVLQSALDAAEEAINGMCQRSFAVAGASSARSYSPVAWGTLVLPIHDCTTISSVVEYGSTLPTANWVAEPYTVSWAGSQKPYTQIRRYMTPWLYDYGKPQIVVTATWGWAQTPKRVVEATKILAKDIYEQRNITGGVQGFGDFGAIRVRENPMVFSLLSKLIREQAFGWA